MTYVIWVQRPVGAGYRLRNGDGYIREFRDQREAQMVADYMDKLARTDGDSASYTVMRYMAASVKAGDVREATP